jgi:hypothetical protein
MDKPDLMLINTVDLPDDQLLEEFEKYKATLPQGTQLSFFDILVHEEGTWFIDALDKLEKE